MNVVICRCEKVTFMKSSKSNFLHYSCADGRKPTASMPMAATFEPHDLTCVLLTCVDLHDLRFTPAVLYLNITQSVLHVKVTQEA